MSILYKLAAVLIIFEVIIMQCKANSNVANAAGPSLNRSRYFPFNERRPTLPPYLMGNIIGRNDFDTIRRAGRAMIMNSSDIDMTELLKDRIVMITPYDFSDVTEEIPQSGDIFIRFRTYGSLSTFLRIFGDKVKKIKISTTIRREDVPHDVNELYNMERFAEQLDELRIYTFHDDAILEALLKKDGADIIFPNVKKFEYYGESSRSEYKLHVIFPNLESFTLIGTMNDANFLANLTKLKELQLSTDSIPKDQLISVIANNKEMTNITLSGLTSMEVMESIANHSTKLKSLNLKKPSSIFLRRPSHQKNVPELPSVTHFYLKYSPLERLVGKLSFDMPNLKSLKLHGDYADDEIIKFINTFDELERVELEIGANKFHTWIENIEKNFKEPIWTVSREELTGIGWMYLTFDRKS